MSQCNTAFDLKINLGHSDLYFSRSSDCACFFFCSEKHFSVLAKRNSGELRCPALVCFLFYGPLTHFRSFRARSVNLATLFLGNPPRQFTST